MSPQKFTFLLPLLDNEGTPFPAADWDWLQDQLVSRFGGWTLEGRVEGAWRDVESGRVYRDSSLRYVVVAERPALLAFLAETKLRFRQLALYVEAPKTEVMIL